MRGSSLSGKVLRPFIVTSWHGVGEMPDDVRGIYEGSDVSNDANVFMFVLDPDGRAVHAFHGLPRGRNPRHVEEQVAEALAKVGEIKEAPPATLRLPDIERGVRLFIRERGRTPIVEVVAWEPPARPESARKIEASTLKAWLVLLYPAAIRTADQSKPFTSITGTLDLTPVDATTALLRGPVRLSKGEGASEFEGTVEAVLTYPGPTLRGTVDGTYVYRLRGEQRIPLTAAIESRP